MSDNQKKRYYWLKLKENFFEEDTIEWLEEQPNGKEYCLIYLKLCLKSLKTDGLLVRNVGNVLIPYEAGTLAKITNSSIDTVKVAMDLFKKIGLIQILDGGEIYINQLNELVGSETEYAKQKRLQRAKKDNVRTLSTECPQNVAQSIEYRDKSIEKEIKDSRKPRKRVYDDDSVYIQLSKYLYQKINEDAREKSEMTKEPDYQTWADDVRKMIDLDGRTPDQVKQMIEWCQSNDFWQGNILSVKKLREKYDVMAKQAKRPATANLKKSVVRNESIPEWFNQNQEEQKLSAEEQEFFRKGIENLTDG